MDFLSVLGKRKRHDSDNNGGGIARIKATDDGNCRVLTELAKYAPDMDTMSKFVNVERGRDFPPSLAILAARRWAQHKQVVTPPNSHGLPLDGEVPAELVQYLVWAARRCSPRLTAASLMKVHIKSRNISVQCSTSIVQNSDLEHDINHWFVCHHQYGKVSTQAHWTFECRPGEKWMSISSIEVKDFAVGLFPNDKFELEFFEPFSVPRTSIWESTIAPACRRELDDADSAPPYVDTIHRLFFDARMFSGRVGLDKFRRVMKGLAPTSYIGMTNHDRRSHRQRVYASALWLLFRGELVLVSADTQYLSYPKNHVTYNTGEAKACRIPPFPRFNDRIKQFTSNKSKFLMRVLKHMRKQVGEALLACAANFQDASAQQVAFMLQERGFHVASIEFVDQCLQVLLLTQRFEENNGPVLVFNQNTERWFEITQVF